MNTVVPASDPWIEVWAFEYGDTLELFSTRELAESHARIVLDPIWHEPRYMQCGSTPNGVEISRRDMQTYYLHGDGYVARVRRTLVRS